MKKLSLGLITMILALSALSVHADEIAVENQQENERKMYQSE